MTWSNVRRAAWIALCATVVALALAKLNLFGLESGSGERADDLAQRLGIVSYHHRDHNLPRPGQDRVRVIHIDDDGLTALKPYWSGWPPGYENLAVMIEDVARAPHIQPARGVFVDLEITGENLTAANQAEFDGLVDTIGALTRAGTRAAPGWNAVLPCLHDPLTTLACMVEWDGVPVIMARGEHPVIMARGEQLPSTGGRTNAPPPERDRLKTVAVLAPTLVDARNYPLATPVPPAGAQPDRKPGLRDLYDLSPAAALYAVNCLTQAKAVGHDVCGVPAIETARAAAHRLRSDPRSLPTLPDWGEVSRSWKQPEAVVWSSDASPRQAALWEQTSGHAAPTCKTRVSWPARVLNQALGKRGPAEGAEQACVYTLSLGYDRIVAGLGLSRDRDYPDLLGDKLILIGVQFRSSDWVPTPLHGSLPGVQYHAMALDNLLEFGRDYRRNEGAGLGRGDLFASILTFLLLFAVNLASIEKRLLTGSKGHLKPSAAIAWYGGLAVIVLGGLALYIWATGFLWRGVMVNWIGILVTVFAAVAFTAKNDISGDLAGWLSRNTLGRAALSAVSAFENSLRPVAPSPPSDKS